MSDEESTFKKIFKDWRVMVMMALIIFSLLSIYVIPPAFDKGIEGNLQLGLDLQGGSWIQISFQSEVARFSSDNMSASEVAEALSNEIGADVIVVSNDQVEIRKYYTEEELRQIFNDIGVKMVSYEQGVSKDTAEDIKRILEDKVNNLGTQDAKINTLSGINDVTSYIRVELAGTDINTAQDLVSSQGKFEIRIITEGNKTEHVLYGDSVTSVSTPSQSPAGSQNWGVGFTLDEVGAEAFREAAIKYGAVDDPKNHNLVMLLDGNVVYSAPLSDTLANKLMSGTVRDLSASTGTGEDALEEAQLLEIHLRAGALPVDVSIAGSGSVPAELGEYFKIVCIVAAILALIAVGITIYFRYREPSIVLPMMLTNVSEIIILLGIARYIQQLDLASIAGLIAVIGTGIDQLVVITDEVLHEGKVPSPNVYLKRFKRALGIITVSACTTIFAMLPLAMMDLSTLKGFAIITILGVLVGVIITRPAYGKIIMAILSKKPSK
ncbi:preprotein translocase subunit SecD [Methanomicrobium sp. W14]|uniref:preprotein translocase subunit SecD n=1 Tax=Methanomicrobium sp. W14 TaxID=2817839 RepID=UPI001AE88D5A|nr:preprotein translocase subunit SecD [Methanomicrobium sp. W14]MBP2132802.1 preprotein translocase subunit SecD [Methanomicrobium sp. W14]